MTFRSEIETQFQQVAREQDKRLAPLTDNLSLLDSGLDSLCFAILVTRLQDSFRSRSIYLLGRRHFSRYFW